MAASDHAFEGLCDVVTAIALAAIPIERMPHLIEDLGKLETYVPNAHPQRIQMHYFIADRIRRTLEEANNSTE